MDVCLQEYGHCNFISEKHCSIFYDEVLSFLGQWSFCWNTESLWSLSNNNGASSKNLTWKVHSHCFKLYCTYSISFNSSNVGNFFWSWIIRLYQSSGKEKESCCLVLRSLAKREIWLFYVVVVQWWQRNVQKRMMQAAKLLFHQSKPIDFLCSHCRRCRLCLSSLFL